MAHNTRQRQISMLQWSARAIALVAILLVACAAWYTYQCLRREVSALALQQQRDLSLLARADAVRQEHARLTERHAALQADWADLKQRIPLSANEAEFLGQLSALAARSAVRLKNFRPGQATVAGPLHKFDVQLSLVGSFSNICKLLDRLEEVPRYLHISRLALTGPNQPGDPCIADISLSICFAPPQVAP